MKISPQAISAFRNTVWKHYLDNKRDMPWRDDTRPYYVLVSEIMLQQTQVGRVIEKFNQFIGAFPDFESLAKAPLSEVLSLWVGLGYNRRAKYLKLCAEKTCELHAGELPNDYAHLVALPGIGPATASAILTYAFNCYHPYIETNVRTVYIHHFFEDKENISDNEILNIVSQCHDKVNPREWCWAVMDYGTFLKKHIGNLNKRSKHYSKQSKFEGSHRQKRGAVIRHLLKNESSAKGIAQCLDIEYGLTEKIIADLVQEGLVGETNGVYSLSS